VSGDRLLHLARAWFADDIVSRIFEPLVADWQIEHAALRGVARRRSALRIWICFAMTATLMLPWQLKQRLPERVTLGGWIVTEGFVVIGMAAQWYFFFDANPRGASHLFPAMLSIALPLALIPAAFAVSRFGTPVEARTMMLRLALLSMLMLAPTLAWWMPHSNQTWRVAQAGEGVRRGGREVMPAELFRSQAPMDVVFANGSNWNTFRRDIVLERASVLFMPLTMMTFGMVAAAGARRRTSMIPISALAAWTVAGLTWLAVLDVLTPWTAHAVLLAAALAVHCYGRQSTALAR
jgi:hypothetical protein